MKSSRGGGGGERGAGGGRGGGEGAVHPGGRWSYSLAIVSWCGVSPSVQVATSPRLDLSKLPSLRVPPLLAVIFPYCCHTLALRLPLAAASAPVQMVDGRRVNTTCSVCSHSHVSIRNTHKSFDIFHWHSSTVFCFVGVLLFLSWIINCWLADIAKLSGEQLIFFVVDLYRCFFSFKTLLLIGWILGWVVKNGKKMSVRAVVVLRAPTHGLE